MTLTFVYVIWKQYCRGAPAVPREILNEGVKEILSGHHLSKDQKFDLDLWLCDLKIIKEHVVSRGIHHTKFGNFQRKVLKDMERTSHGLHTDRKMQNNLPLFSNGGIKIQLEICFVLMSGIKKAPKYLIVLNYMPFVSEHMDH